MYRVRFRKLGSLLGLLAILMVTLAPAVSQVLASHHRLSDALTTYCSAESDVAAPDHDSKPPHSVAAHWQVCPYCSLIAHVPALPGSPVALALPQRSAPIRIAIESTAVRAGVAHTAAQPRAPPVFS
jgi:hypothetical protein